MDTTFTKVVILTDALSVLQALEAEDKNLNDLSTSMILLCQETAIVLQWIPSHCGIHGNEEADTLAKAGTLEEQPDDFTTCKEQKTKIKTIFKKKWEDDHSGYNKDDAYHYLSRKEQVIIFRLRTGHNRLRHRLHSKMRIGPTDLCPYGNAPQTAKHILQECRNLADKRQHFWPTPTDEKQKLFGCLDDLQRTAEFIASMGLLI